jgi:phosphatidylglycerol---prolipoprotein diacylglyceryl transferase
MNYFTWDVDPVIIAIGPLQPRWYGVLFALAFILGYHLMQWMYTREKKPRQNLDQLLIYLIAGTIIGARLGHCLFYDPACYLGNPLKILAVWEGGLASHGVIFGWFLVLIFVSRILVEFVKARQAAYPVAFWLNTGQMLSIPFVLAGMVFLAKAFRGK